MVATACTSRSIAGIARCRLSTATKKDLPRRMALAGAAASRPSTRKSPAAIFTAAKGEQVELIKLYGSMELAPLVGLADLIVDLVDTV